MATPQDPAELLSLADDLRDLRTQFARCSTAFERLTRWMTIAKSEEQLERSRGHLRQVEIERAQLASTLSDMAGMIEDILKKL